VRVLNISPQFRRLRAKLIDNLRDPDSPQDARAGREVVRAALLDLAPNSSLLKTMRRCGTRDLMGNPVRCKRPACPVCARAAGRRYYLRKIQPALAHVPAGQMRYVTILHLLAVDLNDGMRRMRDHEDRALRKIVKSYRSIKWYGNREIEVIRTIDWSMRSTAEQKLLTHLGYRVDASGSLYLYHTHSIMVGDIVELEALEADLRLRWNGTRQVQVQNLMRRRHVANSIRRIISYSHKSRFTRDVGNSRREWLSAQEIVDLVLFTHAVSRGWQAFRFTIQA